MVRVRVRVRGRGRIDAAPTWLGLTLALALALTLTLTSLSRMIAAKVSPSRISVRQTSCAVSSKRPLAYLRASRSALPLACPASSC